MATRVQTGCPFEALPDNLVTSILELATTKVGYSRRKGVEFQKLAQLRMVSSQFRRLALQVDGINCTLDAARTMDARILFFLQEAEAIRKLFLKCETENDDLMASIAGFITAAVNLTPKLEYFRLKSGSLAIELQGNNSDEPAQQAFKALSKCPNLKIVVFKFCKFFPESLLNGPVPFHNLKELSLRGLELPFISTDAVMEYHLDQICPTLEKLTVHGLCLDGSELRIRSRSLKILDLNDHCRARLRKLEIDTPQLEELELVDSEETRINAPRLRTLNFGWPPDGPVVGTPWKVTGLILEGTWKEEPLLHVLELSPNLASLDLECFELRPDNIVRAAEILACLARVEALEASMEIFRTLTLQSRESVWPVTFNLTRLVVEVRDMEELQVFDELVERSPKLGYVEVAMRGAEGVAPVDAVNIFLRLRESKPNLEIELS